VKRLLYALVSAAIIALLWWRIDVDAILAAMRRADAAWLAAGLGMVVPLTLATAWRFGLIAREPLGLGTTTRLILSASTLNLFLPSKMGDIAKAWVLTGRYGMDGRQALAVVVLEKALDMAALLAWGVLALLWIADGRVLLLLAALAVGGGLALLLVLLSPLPASAALFAAVARVLPGKLGRAAAGFAERWGETVAWFWRSSAHALGVIAVSLALWAGHLAQFWLFVRALGAAVPFVDNMAFATLSILVGLAPFTVAGIGTRDAAIVFFYAPWLSPGEAAVLGVLATTRYLMPALAGLPFLRDYWPRRDAARG
jgi:uncharacterized protein (TIRG00374 family)